MDPTTIAVIGTIWAVLGVITAGVVAFKTGDPVQAFASFVVWPIFWIVTIIIGIDRFIAAQ